MRGVRISCDLNLTNAFDRFLCDENSDPRIIITFMDTLRGNGRRAYRSVSSLTEDHFKAYCVLRDAIKEARLRETGAARYADDRPLLLIVLDDPSKALVMRSIIEQRGVISAKNMRGLLRSVDASAPMLSDGAL